MRLGVVAGLAGLILALSACSDAAGEVVEEARWSLPLSERGADPFPRRLGDGVVVAELPQRVVAASVLATELLLSVPLESALTRVDSVHELGRDERYSSAVDAATAFGTFVGATPEQILARGGDLVILDAFTSQATVSLLQEAHPAVLRTRAFDGFEDIQANLRMVGYAVGADRQVEQLIAEMQRVLDEAARGAEDRGSLRVMNLTSNYFAYGKGSMMDAIIRHVGARNAATEAGLGAFAPVGEEGAYGMNPDVLIVGADSSGGSEWLETHPLLGKMECVRQGRVIAIPSRVLDSTSHHVAHAALLLAQRLDALQ